MFNDNIQNDTGSRQDHSHAESADQRFLQHQRYPLRNRLDQDAHQSAASRNQHLDHGPIQRQYGQHDQEEEHHSSKDERRPSQDRTPGSSRFSPGIPPHRGDDGGSHDRFAAPATWPQMRHPSSYDTSDNMAYTQAYEPRTRGPQANQFEYPRSEDRRDMHRSKLSPINYSASGRRQEQQEQDARCTVRQQRH